MKTKPTTPEDQVRKGERAELRDVLRENGTPHCRDFDSESRRPVPGEVRDSS